MHFLIIYLKGLCMGAADVVPGVSGGTVAFITGIYERLLQAIAHVDRVFFGHLSRGEFRTAWTYLDGSFLLTLGAGIVSSFLILSRVILYLIDNHSLLFWGGMGGLILASTFLVWKQLKIWSWRYIAPLCLGGVLAYAISTGTPTATPDALWFIFLSGMIAICAMILPGISGSFILVLLGKYEYMMAAIKEVRILEIVVFIAGCLFGILSFAKILKWLFSKYHDLTVMIMAGFMLGSLVKLWPWKTLETVGNYSREINISPQAFEAIGTPAQLPEVIGVFVLCFFVVLGLEYVAMKK